MTYNEAKSEVAKKHGLGTTLVAGHRAGYFEEAMELYVESLKQEVRFGEDKCAINDAIIRKLQDDKKELEEVISIFKKNQDKNEQVRTEFVHWLFDNGWEKYKGIDYWKNETTEPIPYTGMRTKKYKLAPQITKELFEIFKSEKNDKNNQCN